MLMLMKMCDTRIIDRRYTVKRCKEYVLIKDDVHNSMIFKPIPWLCVDACMRHPKSLPALCST